MSNIKTIKTSVTTEFYAQNSVTKKFFNGTDWNDLTPVVSFPAPHIAFLRMVWMNVQSISVFDWDQSAASEGWSTEWFR